MFKFILHVFRGDSSISYMYDTEKFHGLGMWVTFFKKKLYGPFSWMGFNCLKATATSRWLFTFYH